eukprot:Gb_20856 [translate_table: standard]
MLERDTGRPRGFGFVTFADERAMEDAIFELHGRDLDGRTISVSKAKPKAGMGDEYGYGGGYGSGGRVDYGDRAPGRSDCFKCGQPGHWARECPSGGGGRFSSRPRYSGSRGTDRFGGGDRYGSGRYSDKARGNDDRDRYSSRDRYGSERYGSDRYAQDGYGKGKSYDRDGGRGSDRYGSGGPTRYEGSYRERPAPYERSDAGVVSGNVSKLTSYVEASDSVRALFNNQPVDHNVVMKAMTMQMDSWLAIVVYVHGQMRVAMAREWQVQMSALRN